MKYPIELHSRNRPIVKCEAYDRVSNSTIVKEGILMQISRGKAFVSIPTANIPRHSFHLIDSGDGYGYEQSMHAARGWRIKLDQLEKHGDQDIQLAASTLPAISPQGNLAEASAVQASADQGNSVQSVPES